MNKIIPILLLITISYGQDTISNDAIALTLKLQNTIWLDSLLACEIDDALTTARSVNDTLIYCTAWPDYAFTELSFGTDTTSTLHWDENSVFCGDQYLDSLAMLYNAIDISIYPWSAYLIEFAQPLQMWLLGELYEAHPNIQFAEPNYYIGDGHRILPFFKNDKWHFVFSFGWGDCVTGCMARNYYYVLVENDSNAIQEEFVDWDDSNERIFRWNIPEFYILTVFDSVNELYNQINTSSDWWVRRHGVEAMWRAYVYENTCYGTPPENPVQYALMRLELIDRIDESISVLHAAMNDEDEDVVVSATLALEKINVTSTAQNTTIPDVFSLHQNYPNPFNPVTTIQYELSERSDVRIIIYDLLGKEIATLVSETQSAGFKLIQWDASNVPSGMYFYQIRAGEFVETRKMVLLK